MLVSVAIITHNRKDLLKKAIESVFSQTITDLELIIVDDGSTDGTPEMVNSIADKRIKYIYSTQINNVPKLRNLSISECQGKYIAFLDSDDTWIPDKLSAQLDVMQKENTNICICGYQVVNIKNEQLKKDLYVNLINKKSQYSIFNYLMRNKFVIYPSTFIFQKSLLRNNSPFNEKIEVPEHDLFAKLLSKNKCSFVFNDLVKILKHNQHFSNKSYIIPLHNYVSTAKHLWSTNKISRFRYYVIKVEMLTYEIVYRIKKHIKNKLILK